MKKMSLLENVIIVIVANKCERFYSIRSELKRKDYWTFHKRIKYWDVYDPSYNETNRKFENKPIRDPLFRM